MNMPQQLYKKSSEKSVSNTRAQFIQMDLDIFPQVHDEFPVVLKVVKGLG